MEWEWRLAELLFIDTFAPLYSGLIAAPFSVP